MRLYYNSHSNLFFVAILVSSLALLLIAHVLHAAVSKKQV